MKMNKNLSLFDNHQYLNIETFRKNGNGVKTPVWFVQNDDALLVWTESQSGKAKRIRQNGHVNIAPCTASGEPLGEWVSASAFVHDSPEAVAQVTQSMRRKYGVPFTLFRMAGRIRKAQYTAIKIQINKETI
ncbi:MAG: PPOX class F420-dependent oxidoreductase [Anaerolineales bacterium]